MQRHYAVVARSIRLYVTLMHLATAVVAGQMKCRLASIQSCGPK